MTDHHTPDSGVDAERELRKAVDETIELHGAGMQSAQDRSVRLNRIRLHLAIEEHRSPRFRTWRTAGAVVVTAAAALAVVALAPWSDSGSSGDRGHAGIAALSSLPASASAADALDWAGDVIVGADGTAADAGAGSVWYRDADGYVDGELASVNEQWFDARSGEYLMAAYGIDRTDAQRQLLLVDAVDAHGTQHVRTFERTDESGDWTRIAGVGPGHAGPPDTFDVPQGQGPRQRSLGVAVTRWIDQAAGSSDTVAIAAATDEFMEATLQDHFMISPDVTPDMLQHGQSPQRGAQTDLDDASRVRQVMYLLTTVRATPAATRYLYDQVRGFHGLERLSDVTIDGRPAIRIRFDSTDADLSPTRERVLVLDAATGYALRTETVDRRSWTDLRAATRVADIGSAPRICDVADDLPCATLAFDGPLADEADAAAQTWSKSDAGARTFGGQMGQVNAFNTVVPIADPADGDGVVSPPGQCTRDAGYLSICRG